MPGKADLVRKITGRSGAAPRTWV